MGGKLMVEGAATSRHLRWELFEARIHKGPPSLENVDGNPRIDLFVEPQGRRIGARVYSNERFSIPSPLSEVSIRAIGVGKETALEISTANPALFREFYSLCCLIADRIQVEGEPISLAVCKTLELWTNLVRPKNLLSATTQVGLIGELLFLQRAAMALSWESAARGWYGPGSEEHDFVLPSVDVEVKTTTQEQRIHAISSLRQLLPKTGRRLYLVSVQLTPADTAHQSFSLPALVVKSLTAAASVSEGAAQLVRNRLRSLKWFDEDSAHYQERYCLRGPLEACHVGRQFPAIVPETLDSLGPSQRSRIEHIEYSINVDGLGAPEGSKIFDRLFHNRATL